MKLDNTYKQKEIIDLLHEEFYSITGGASPYKQLEPDKEDISHHGKFGGDPLLSDGRTDFSPYYGVPQNNTYW